MNNKFKDAVMNISQNEAIKEVNIANDNMKTSFIKDIYNKNPEQAKKDYPFLTSVLMTNENYKCGETKEDFFERSLRKLK